MSDPRRLLEEGTDFERALLESASLDAPTPARRRRLVATAAATTATAVATSASASIAGWKIVLGVLFAGSLATVAITRTVRDPGERPAVVDPPSTPIVRSPMPLPSIAPSVVQSVAVVPSSSPPLQAKPTIAPSSEKASTAPSLALEVKWIDAARTGVRAKDGAAALRALDGYDRECGGGAFAIEAAVLRVEATALTGDLSRASTLAHAFLAAHPSSPQAPRVRKYAVAE